MLSHVILSLVHQSQGALYKFVHTIYVEIVLPLCLTVFILVEMSEKEMLS